jgi:hypothetical protein
MGLRHFGQGGGGGFLGTMLTLDQARAEPNSQSPVNAEDGAVMPNLKARSFPVCLSGPGL